MFSLNLQMKNKLLLNFWDLSLKGLVRVENTITEYDGYKHSNSTFPTMFSKSLSIWMLEPVFVW